MIVSEAAVWIVEKLVDTFGKKVVKRWSQHRSQQFIETFVEAYGAELRESEPSADVNRKLMTILEDEHKSEALFESYRRVALSASKDIGPKIIALVMARCIHEERPPSDFEDLFMMAAESLTDGELRVFRTFFDEHHSSCLSLPPGYEEENNPNLPKQLRVGIDRKNETTEHGPHHRGSASFALVFGVWAQKLRNIGIVREDILVEDQLHGHHIKFVNGKPKSHPDSSVITSWWLIVEPEFFELINLIKRAERANPI